MSSVENGKNVVRKTGNPVQQRIIKNDEEKAQNQRGLH